MLPFEPMPIGRPRRAATWAGSGSDRAISARRLELDDLTAPSEAPPDPLPPSPPPQRDLWFGEAELARACAAAAVAAARATEEAGAARAAARDAALRERLLAAVEALRAEQRARESRFQGTLRDLLAAALQALVPALREIRMAAALERVLDACIGEQGRPEALIVELSERDLPLLAPRLPAMLAEVGLDGAWEIRAHSGDELVRLVWGETWVEIDAASWAAAVCERVRGWLDGTDHGRFSATREEHERDGQ